MLASQILLGSFLQIAMTLLSGLVTVGKLGPSDSFGTSLRPYNTGRNSQLHQYGAREWLVVAILLASMRPWEHDCIWSSLIFHRSWMILRLNNILGTSDPLIVELEGYHCIHLQGLFSIATISFLLLLKWRPVQMSRRQSNTLLTDTIHS